MTSHTHSLKQILASLLDIILPRKKEVRFLESATPSEFARNATPAHHELPHITSLFSYKNPLVKTAVWEIKYKGNRMVTELTGHLLYEHLLGELGERVLFSDNQKILIIPVPLAPKRFRERGFNQATRLARLIEKMDEKKHVEVIEVVSRIRETTSQTKSKNRAERLRNLTGAFAVQNTDVVFGRHIIILDDVTTTGATIDEIRKILLEAGAASVTGLTFAH